MPAQDYQESYTLVEMIQDLDYQSEVRHFRLSRFFVTVCLKGSQHRTNKDHIVQQFEAKRIRLWRQAAVWLGEKASAG
jgi:hypothetical protein